jgi:hypothetical protein
VIESEAGDWSEQGGWIANLEGFEAPPGVRLIEPMLSPSDSHILVALPSPDRDIENHPERLRFLAASSQYYWKAELFASMMRAGLFAEAQAHSSNPHFQETVELFSQPGPKLTRPIVGTFVPLFGGDDDDILNTCLSYCRYHVPQLALFTFGPSLAKAFVGAFPSGTPHIGPTVFFDWWAKLAIKDYLAATEWSRYGHEGAQALAQSGGMGKRWETEEQERAILDSVLPSWLPPSPDWERPDEKDD